MMEPLRAAFSLPLDYPVYFSRRVFDADNPLLARLIAAGTAAGKPGRTVVCMDAGVVRHHPDLLVALDAYARAHADALTFVAPPQVLPGGERIKNAPVYVGRLHRMMAEAGVCRHSYVVAVGGGAVLDCVGYAAATAHRGVRLIRVPTTVLAQGDAGVGTKNGVNACGRKNFCGVFAPPVAVLNDATFLATLGDRDWRAGLAEAVKVALLRDPPFFARLEGLAGQLRAGRDLDAMETVIHRSAALHLQHIATGGDPFEMGSARPLDFGHWSAHKLEQLTRYRLRHGEAVAIGIALDCTVSHLSGTLSADALRRIIALFEALGLPVWHEALVMHLDDPQNPDSIWRGLDEFREHLGGELCVTLLDDIGTPRDVHALDRDVVRAAVEMRRPRRGL